MARVMKDSGFKWINEIPQQWGMLKVKHAFVRKNEKAMQDDPIILSLARSGVRVRDVSTNEGQIAESYLNYNPVSIGDLLLNPMDLYSGANCSISNVEGVISPAYVNLQSKDGFISEFYDYYFKVQYWLMAFFAYGKGVSFDNRWTLNNETLMNYPITAPPLPEQQAIADYLDCKCALIDSTIEKQKAVIEKLRLYKQSAITEAVTKGLDKNAKMKPSGIEWIGDIPEGWEVRKLKDIGEAIIGLTYAPTDVSDKGTLVLRSSNVQDNKIVFDDNVFVEKLIKDNLIVKLGDILICSRNGSKSLIGKCALIDENTAGHSFGAFMTVYRSSHNRFVFYVLNSAIFSFHLATFLTSTINQLTTSNLNGIAIPLPESIEQKAITDYLDEKCAGIDTAIANKQKVIDKLTDYKKSLIYECVTGKREIQNVV